MARQYNELKELLLHFLSREGSSQSKEIANSLELSIGNTKMAMLRLRRQGLVSRSPGERIGKGRRPNIYSVTGRGVERLEWLERLIK